MSYRYSAIKLSDNFSNYLDKNGNQLEEIDGLSLINIFVGANNSGKSRFLRSLALLNPIEFRLNGLNLNDLKQELDLLNVKLEKVVNDHGNVVTFSVRDFPGQFNVDRAHGNNDLNLAAYYDNFNYFGPVNFTPDQDTKNLKRLYRLLKALLENEYSMLSHRGSGDIRQFESSLKLLLKENESILEKIEPFNFDEIQFGRFYVPILRSLNSFDEARESNGEYLDIYEARIKKIYHINDQVNVFTGQRLYNRVKEMLLGEPKDRTRITEYEKFLSETLFENQEVVLIPREHDDVLHIKIGERERPVFDLGDGIQSLIILTFPLFESDHSIFFIEEPEMNLHPGMQRKFIEALLRKGHQCFITTHSNHFLDLTLDYDGISIFTFRDESSLKGKKDYFSVNQINSGDESALRLLGVQNSSVFLSNSTIWVEGITDRLYIRKFLELYQDHEEKIGTERIYEDIDYSFVEYGGSNVTHWSFFENGLPPINVERLCGKLFLIVDGDGGSKKKRKQVLKAYLKERFYTLPGREIENILSLDVLKKVVVMYEKNSSIQFPKFRKSSPHMQEKIGEFIEEKLLKKSGIKRRGGYRDESGTIKRKLDFCEKATKGMVFADMTPEAKKLVKKIYRFVLTQKTAITH